jgi:phospholipid/cholesterol/gamma-HCH transport system substrate-binding protein
MKGKTNYVLVGLFVLLLSFTLIAGILWLGAGGPGRAYDEYLVYMQESVSGLSRDNAVKYHGVDVGRVHKISLASERDAQVSLLLQIDRGTPVRADTVATLEAQGLTGLAYINLVGGSVDSPLLEAREGEDYPVIKSRPSTWRRLDLTVTELASNLTDISAQLKVLLSDENQRRLSRSLAQLDELSGALAGRSGTITATLDDLAVTLRNTRETSVELTGLVTEMKSAALALERMADDVRDTSMSVRQVVESRDRDLQRFTSEALPEAAAMINEARRAAQNLRRFSEQLERDPAVLLRGRPTRAPGPGE